MNRLDRLVVAAQGAWVSKTIHLAPEPLGERSGVVSVPGAGAPEGAGGRAGAAEGTGEPGAAGGAAEAVAVAPLRLVGVGDSTIAACGVPAQSAGMVPRLAARVAGATGAPVEWETVGRLGATVRRVRHRLMPAVMDPADVVVLSVGSNDLMARRTLAEWRDDLAATLDAAGELAGQVALCQSGAVYANPWLPRRLRAAYREARARQSEVSMAVCAERGVAFVGFEGSDLSDDFWADDHFHPNENGYQFIADLVWQHLEPALAPAREG